MGSDSQHYIPKEYFHRTAKERSRQKILEIEEERYEYDETAEHSHEVENIDVNKVYA